MMHLQWHGANGQILDIREPDNAVPDPPYVYLTSSGFGGGGCDVQTVRAEHRGSLSAPPHRRRCVLPGRR